MFSLISLPVPSQQMTMFLMDAASPRVAGGSLATGGGVGYWDLGLRCRSKVGFSKFHDEPVANHLPEMTFKLAARLNGEATAAVRPSLLTLRGAILPGMLVV